MRVYVADVHAHVQRRVSVVKMATPVEVYNTTEERSVVRLSWSRKLSTKDIHKEIFPVYDGNCLSCKAV
jgi:hypothetical protein